MTLQTAIGMLKVANTGNDLIAILDVISNDMDVNNANDIACVGVTDFNGNAVVFWYTSLDLCNLPMLYWRMGIWGKGCVWIAEMCKTFIVYKTTNLHTLIYDNPCDY